MSTRYLNGRRGITKVAAKSISTRLISLMWPLKGRASLAIILGVLTIGSGIGLMATSAWLISAAALHPSVSELSMAIVGVRFFGISRGVFRYLERLSSHTVTLKLLSRLRTWFYASVEPLAPAVLNRFTGGDLLGRIVSDVDILQELYVRGLAPPFVALIVSLGMLIFMAAYNRLLAVGLLPFLLLAGIGLPFIVRWSSARPGRQLVAIRAKLQTRLVDSILGMADLIANGQSRATRHRIQQLNRQLAARQRHMAWIAGFHEGISILLSNLSMWIVLVLAIVLVDRGELNGLYLAMLTLATLTTFEAFQPLPLAAQQWDSSLKAARRLFEILDAKPVVFDPREFTPLPIAPDIQIKDLRFRYGSEGAWTLDKISFDLPRGKWMAIVGPSGAGKSTLANLIFRLWDYEEGQILLSGRDIKRYAQDEVRKLLSVVAQDSHIFNAPVDENIRIANPTIDTKGVHLAARRAQLHDFLDDLPRGYRTHVGELGMGLSGGQRQRLITARAFARQSPIWILDEPTANLDPLTERRLLQTILRLARGKSLLLITHRLLGMEQMDEILVFEEGKIVERGKHDKLCQKGGLYAQMWRLQHEEKQLD